MPLVTVSEMLRFALPAGSTVLAGAAGLGNAVSWARLLRARPTNLGRIETGEVWLLSTAALQLMGEMRSIARMPSLVQNSFACARSVTPSVT